MPGTINFGSDFLRKLVEMSAGKNRKYEKSVKETFTSIYLVGGKMLYGILYQLLDKKCPCLSTIRKFINSIEDVSFREGYLRMAEFRKFLDTMNYPRFVWLSEDMTKIKPRKRYCSSTNSIVGLSVPLDSDTGMPFVDTFEFSSLEKALAVCEKYKNAEYVNAIMGQSLCPDSTPFCLMLYGSDNKFTHLQPLKRWEFLTDVAASMDIGVLGMS